MNSESQTNKKACRIATRLCLFNVGVIADVILTVAVVATAAGAVTELQLGIGNIGSSAHGAAVGVVVLAFLPLGRCELHHPGTVGLGLCVFVLSALQFDPPG